MAKAARLLVAMQPEARWRRWIGAAIIAAVTILAYWPAINAGFIWDDDSYVTQNPLVQEPEGLWRIWIPRQTPQYYPAVFTTFWIEFHIWGLRPLGYHFVNVLLHIANALLVWRLCVMLRIPGAWLIGAVFAVHPINVESVAWITERKNVLSGFFYLSAAMMYLRFENARERREPASDFRGVWGRYALALILFVLALLSKTVTCSLPAALILMMLWQRRRLSVQRLAPLVPMFIIGLALALNTAMIEREHVGAEGVNFAFSIADRILIASRALLFYPWKMLWPHPLMFIYPRWTIDESSVWSYWTVAVVALIGAAALWGYWRGWRGPALALAYYAGTILPALGFFNVYPMLFSFVADHFAYLASLGIITVVIAALTTVVRTPRRLAIVAATLLPILATLTMRQSTAYLNAETLWRDTVEKNPDSWMPHNNLANQVILRAAKAIESGDQAAGQALLDEAMHHVQRALELRPHYREAMSNMASLLMMQGRSEDALNYAQLALRHIEEYQAPIIAKRGLENPISPPRASALWEVARLQELLNRDDDAMANYLAARQWNPRDSLIQKETFRFLIEHGKQALQQDRHGDADRLFRELHVQAEGDDQRLDAGYWLAHFLSTCPDATFRNPDEAVRVAEDLHRQSVQAQRESPFILGVLAAAYASAGRFDDAARAGEEGLKMARQLGRTDVAGELERQLNLYRQGRGP